MRDDHDILSATFSDSSKRSPISSSFLNLSILSLRFTGTGKTYLAIYAIHFQSSFRDSSMKMILSRLLMGWSFHSLFAIRRLDWLRCTRCLGGLSFNSLFKIPEKKFVNFVPKDRNFQFSFWDSGHRLVGKTENLRCNLSILFLRFVGLCPWDSGLSWSTFNSLFEIRVFYLSPHKSLDEIFNFQFSFWDSTEYHG